MKQKVKTINNLRNGKGFTLIELLVVIAIIGTLAAVVLVSLNSARAKSRDAKRIADVRQMMTALELYYNDQNQYPVSGSLVLNGDGLSSGGGWGAVSGTTYMERTAAAPTPLDGGCVTAENDYTYEEADANGTDYTLTFCLGGVTGGLGAGVHTAKSSGIQ